MVLHPTTLDTHTRLENFKPNDVKNLIQQKGKAREGNKQFVLLEPAFTDPTLQAIINDPNFEIKSIGNQHKGGEMYYDLTAEGRQVRIKVNCRKLP